MASAYLSFLQTPTVAQLASDASIAYITTTTHISEPAAIVKHLTVQQKQAEKKSEKVLSSVEGPDSLFLETETTLQLHNGGGAFLPSVDENLLDEKLVTFPLLHVVTFDTQKKIKHIRLHWDQGTLLKQVEAIGRTGRNWPIRDGQAQIEAINRSIKSDGSQTDRPKTPLAARSPNEVVIREHTKNESIGALRNHPGSVLAPRDTNEEVPQAYNGPKLAASARPPPRDLGELFAGEDTTSTSGSKDRSVSPSKMDGVVLKSGAGKHYGDSRLFDETDESTMPSPERKKTYTQKYDHFAFGDGEDAPEVSRPTSGSNSSKGGPTFSFDDFSTPLKAKPKFRPDDQLHWGNDEYTPPASPPKRPVVHAARKDAVPHFDMNDESSSTPTDKPKSLQRQAGMGLYNNPTSKEDTARAAASSRNTTNTNNARRGTDFGDHANIADIPGNNENAAPNPKRATRSDMDQHWGWGTPQAVQKIYKTAGDGMGSRKGGRSWRIGDDSEE